MPDGAAAVAAFLGFIAPGILFEVVAGRRRAPVKHTALFEVGRAVLVSTACTGMVALGVLLCWRAWGPDVALMNLWAIDPDLTIIGALTAVGLSCGLALLAGWLTVRGRGAPVVGISVLQVALNRSPEGAEPRLRIAMRDGTIWQGRYGSRTVGVDDDNPWLELVQPLRRRRKDDTETTELVNWSSVVLPERQAVEIMVAHTPKAQH